MKIKKIKLPKFLADNPGGKRAKKVRDTAQKVFGFSKVDRDKYRKSPELDEDMVIDALARLETDMNWVKRLFWLLVAGGVGSQFLG